MRRDASALIPSKAGMRRISGMCVGIRRSVTVITVRQRRLRREHDQYDSDQSKRHP